MSASYTLASRASARKIVTCVRTRADGIPGTRSQGRRRRRRAGVALLVFMSYISLFVALGQAYAMYIVYKRSKALGAKMTIKEFGRSAKADVVSKIGTILN